MKTLVLVLSGLLAAGPAWALSYGETYDVLEFVDEQNKANAVGLALSAGMAIAGPTINSAAGGLAGGLGIENPALQAAAQGAIQGAIVGGISDAVQGGDGSGIGWGAAAGAVSGAIMHDAPKVSNTTSVKSDDKAFGGLISKSTVSQVGGSMLASEAGKGAAHLAIRKWGANPQSAQFLGMVTSGTTAGVASNGDVLNNLGLSAAQAGVYIGTESALKDKDYAPYVAGFAGETLGTLGFAAVAGKIQDKSWKETKTAYFPDRQGQKKNVETGEVKPETIKGSGWDSFTTNAIADGLGTALTSTMVDADKPAARAQMFGNVTSQAARSFLNDQKEGGGLELQNWQDYTAEAAANVGAYYGMEKLHQGANMSQTALDYTVATSANALQYAIGKRNDLPEEATQEQRNQGKLDLKTIRNRAQKTQLNIADFSHDPDKYDGETDGHSHDPDKYNGETDGHQAHQATASGFNAYGEALRNSQIHNFTGLDGLTARANQYREQGQDWRESASQNMARGPFPSFATRAANVYDSAARQAVAGAAYGEAGVIPRLGKPSPQTVPGASGNQAGWPTTETKIEPPNRNVDFEIKY